MTSSRPFLGTTATFSEAYPRIAEVSIEVTQDSSGYYTRNQMERKCILSKERMISEVACRNPRCRRGGFNIDQLLRIMDCKALTEICPGDEGSPQGRHRGVPCENIFYVTATVRYKQPE